MDNILAFASQHWFLAWCALWLIWAIVPLAWVVMTIILAPFRYINRRDARAERTKRILAHGWPTQDLMDADGNIVHPKPPEANK